MPSRSPTPKGEPQEPKAIVKRWVYQHFGLWGLAGLAILGFVIYLWWNWDKVKNLPGVPLIISRVSQEPLPKADPKRFAIAVAHLENDRDRQQERLIVEALKDFKGIQILRFDRAITLEGFQPEEGVKAGHESAHQYLKESGAHVLIWGTILSREGKSVPKLYWTTTRDFERERQGARYQLTEDLNLPDIFWNDLVGVLRLLAVTQYVEFSSREGHFIADPLSPFIDKVRHLVGGGMAQQGGMRRLE